MKWLMHFVQLEQSGKVRYFGVSNFTPYQFDLLQSRHRFPLVTNPGGSGPGQYLCFTRWHAGIKCR